MHEQLKLLALVIDRLERLNIPYMVTGSVAAAIYSQPRMTRDIDIVAEIRLADVDRLVDAFKTDCLIDADAIRDAINRSSMFNLIHREWAAKVDFVVRKSSRYRETEFARRRGTTISGVNCYVVALEDLILSKLLWRKESRSELQLSDVRSLLTSPHPIDFNYLRQWAQQLGVDRDLKEAEGNE